MKILFSKLSTNLLSLLASGQGEASSSDVAEISVVEAIGKYFKGFFGSIIEKLVNIIWTVFLTIGKLCLNIIDFFSICIRDLAGQNSVTNLSNVTKVGDSDMVFRYLFNFDNGIWKVFIAILALSIVLLIIFSIVAIIKSEYNVMINNEDDNGKMQIIKKTLTSLFLILIVPVISFGGIILSNAVLKSIDNAFKRVGDNNEYSIGAEIFIASTYEANMYRQYANNDQRIPIYFTYDNENIGNLKLPQSEQVSTMNESMSSYLEKSVWKRGFATYCIFVNKEFYSFSEAQSSIDYQDANGEYLTYDKMFDGELSIFRDEYYVMADLVDYLVRTGRNLYVVDAYKLAQEYGVYYSDVSINSADLNFTVTTDPTKTIFRAMRDGNGNIKYYFDVQYDDSYSENINSVETVAGTQNTKRYYFNNTSDEKLGAQFLMCELKEVIENEGTENEVITTKYVPLTNNTSKTNSNSNKFYSNYLKFSQPIVARGAFSVEGYPTAIKEDNGNIIYYREDVYAPNLLDLLPAISYELPEGEKESLGSTVAKGTIKFFSGIDLNDFLPYVYFRNDMWNFFTKRETTQVNLKGGELYINYNFSEGAEIENIYHISDINILILMFSSVLLLSILLKAVFGLIGRVFELILLFITFPAFASTMPIDGGKRFSNWSSAFISKIFAAYGIVIGINFVFLLLPVLNTMEFFTPEFISKNVKNLGSMSAVQFTAFMNVMVKILFSLVLFTFFKTAIGIVNTFTGGDDVLASGDAISGDIKTVAQKVGNVITGKFAIDYLDKIKKGEIPGAGFIPGGAVLSKLKSRSKEKKEEKQLKASIAARKNQLLRGDVSAIAGTNKKQAEQDKKIKDSKGEKDIDETKDGDIIFEGAKKKDKKK